MIHHRTPEFDAILKRVLFNLKKIFFSHQDVYIFSSTGSGGMEALIVNVLNPGDEVLSVVSGKFGERWADMAETFGARVTRFPIPWGERFPLDQFEDILIKKPFSAVLTQACETSTGAAHPIAKMGDIVRKTQNKNCLFLVDGITALGAYPLPMDDWNIDGLVGGSQKAFMLPTGLSFVCLSDRAWEKAEQVKTPRFYFDLRKEREANKRSETYFSSSVAHIRALDWVLSDLLSRGIADHFKPIERRCLFTRTFCSRLGLSLFPQSPSLSLTALRLPPDLDGQKIRSRLESEFAITVMGGQDQLKGKILRIGHMGYIKNIEMIRLIKALSQVLQSEGWAFPPFDEKELVSWWENNE
jgi:aspartate aminotransferase-like enzyme